MPHTRTRMKLSSHLFQYLVFLLLANSISYSKSIEQYGKLITEGKLCTDIDVDDVNGEYTDLGTDVDLPTLFYHVKVIPIPYPHTLRIVVPVGSVIQFKAFAAMAVDESGIPTGRFHSCDSDSQLQQNIISSGRCTITKKDWQLTFMGYQEPLQIISTEKYSEAIEFYWTWVGDRPPPSLIQFRFLGIEQTPVNARAQFYGVLASPVVETTDLFQQTPAISLEEFNKIRCFEAVELKTAKNLSIASDYFFIAPGFSPQQQIPLNPDYLKLIQDNIDAFNKSSTTVLDEEQTTTKPNTKHPKPRKHHKNVPVQRLHELQHLMKHVNKSDHHRAENHDQKMKRQRKSRTTQSTTTTELIKTTLSEEEIEEYDIPAQMYESFLKKARQEDSIPAQKYESLPNKTMQEDNSQLEMLTFREIPVMKKSASHFQDNIQISSPKINNSTFKTAPQPNYRGEFPVKEQRSSEMTTDGHEQVTENPNPQYTIFHVISMLFVWFVCVPNAIFITRYFEDGFTIKLCHKSWTFILHWLLFFIAFFLMAISFSITFMDFLTSKRIIALLQDTEIDFHIYLGVASSILLGALVLFGCFTCKHDNAHCITASVHGLAGNISYILALIIVWKSHYIGMPCATWIISLFWIIWSVSANFIMCCHFYWKDRTLGFKNFFRAFVPMPITANTNDKATGFHIKERILWWHFGGSYIAFTITSLLYFIKDPQCANCQFEFVLGCTTE